MKLDNLYLSDGRTDYGRYVYHLDHVGERKSQGPGQAWIITAVYGPGLHSGVVVVKFTVLVEAVHEQ